MEFSSGPKRRRNGATERCNYLPSARPLFNGHLFCAAQVSEEVSARYQRRKVSNSGTKGMRKSMQLCFGGRKSRVFGTEQKDLPVFHCAARVSRPSPRVGLGWVGSVYEVID